MSETLEGYEQSKWSYCCICGEDIQKKFHTLTEWHGIWEQYICIDHTEVEINDYCGQRIPGYCGICGKPFDKGDKPKCGHDAEY